MAVPPLAAALLLLPAGPLRVAGWSALALACAALVWSRAWSGARRPWRWVGGRPARRGRLRRPGRAVGLGVLPDGPVAPAVVVRLLAYLPLLVGVFLLTEPAPRRPDPWALLDAAVIVVAVVAVGALVVADGRADGLPLLALPLLDVVLLVSAWPLSRPRRPARPGPCSPWGSRRCSAPTSCSCSARPPAARSRCPPPAACCSRRCWWPWRRATRARTGCSGRPGAGRDPGRARPHVTPRRLLLLGTGLVGAPLLLLLALLGLLPGTPRVVPLAAFVVFGLAALRLAHLVAELVRHEADLEAQRRFAAAFDRSPGGLGLVAVTGATPAAWSRSTPACRTCSPARPRSSSAPRWWTWCTPRTPAGCCACRSRWPRWRRAHGVHAGRHPPAGARAAALGRPGPRAARRRSRPRPGATCGPSCRSRTSPTASTPRRSWPARPAATR